MKYLLCYIKLSLFSGLIDAALEECDVNNDGYLSYSEFKAGRARAYARNDGSDEI